MQNINEIMEYMEKEEEVNIKDFLFRILSKWYWFAVCGFLGLAAAVFMTKRSPATYKMSASIIVNDESKAMGLDNLFEGFDLGNKTNAENHILMLQSYTLNRQAVEILNLDVSWVSKGLLKDNGIYGNTPYQIQLEKSKENISGVPVFVKPISDTQFTIFSDATYYKNGAEHSIDFETNGTFDQPLESKYFNFTLSKNSDFTDDGSNTYYFVVNNLNRLTKSYLGRLSVSLANKKADGITLSLEETIPARGVDYMNKLIESYLKYGLNEKNRTAENTVRFIDEQLEGIIDSLNSAGEQFTRFRSQKGVIDLSMQAKMVSDKLQQLESEKELAQRKIKYFTNLHQYMGNAEEMKLMVAPSVQGIADAGLNAQVVKLAELYSRKSSLGVAAEDKNPVVVMLNEEISNTINSLEENINNLVKNTEVEYNNIKAQLSTIEMELAGLPKTEQELINIKRSFDLNNELYTFLLQKRAEAAITKASNVPDAHVLDPARIETVEQTGPKSTLNMLIGLIIGLAVPFIVIVLSDYFNDSIKGLEELQKSCKLPISAEIAHNNYPIEIPVAKHPRSGIAETFRALRVNLQYMANKKEAKIVAIHSMISGEGKTFCSLNLASILALDNKKVLLVGCDLRKPKLHKVFNEANDKGLSTFLIDQDNFKSIVRETDQEGLFYVNSGPVPPNPSELIGNGHFKTFIEEAKNGFDYIILDNAPITLVIDGFLIGKHADINLAVIRQGYSHKKQIEYINQLKEKDDFKNPGVILNDTVYNGYGNRYKSYYGHGKGYYDDNYEVKGFFNKLKRRFVL